MRFSSKIRKWITVHLLVRFFLLLSRSIFLLTKNIPLREGSSLETVLCGDIARPWPWRHVSGSRSRDLEVVASRRAKRRRSARDRDRASRETSEAMNGGRETWKRLEEAEREGELEKMIPTRGDGGIEGRSYKDYAYSPVAVSPPSSVYKPPVRESVDSNTRGRTSLRTTGHRCPEEMTEKGSKLPQFLAASAGESASVRKGLNPRGEKKIKLIHRQNAPLLDSLELTFRISLQNNSASTIGKIYKDLLNYTPNVGTWWINFFSNNVD